MRHLLAPALICGLALAHSQAAHSQAAHSRADDLDASTTAAPVAPSGNIPGSFDAPDAVPAGGSTKASASTPHALENGLDLICRTIESAASSNGLPLEFFTRLIWQESRFDAYAVSRAGARGIAQFMPQTAQWVGLSDPFDAADAINKSAALLRNLSRQFGNLGLAAAAYNAGPKRVSNWLAGRRSLPPETLGYVRIVTGHQASEWSINPAAATANFRLPNSVPCTEIAKLFAEHRSAIAVQSKLRPASTSAASSANPSRWGVQLIGGPSQLAALASFYQMRKTYRSVLGAYAPIVIRTPVGTNGAWYRVRVGTATRSDAEQLCSNLRAAGGSCLIQPN